MTRCDGAQARRLRRQHTSLDQLRPRPALLPGLQRDPRGTSELGQPQPGWADSRSTQVRFRPKAEVSRARYARHLDVRQISNASDNLKRATTSLLMPRN